jgi:hypothetical protein
VHRFDGASQIIRKYKGKATLVSLELDCSTNRIPDAIEMDPSSYRNLQHFGMLRVCTNDVCVVY